MTGPGQPKMPECLKKQRVTIRLRPWIIEFIRDHEINLSEEIQQMLYEQYGDIIAGYISFKALTEAGKRKASKHKIKLPDCLSGESK